MTKYPHLHSGYRSGNTASTPTQAKTVSTQVWNHNKHTSLYQQDTINIHPCINRTL